MDTSVAAALEGERFCPHPYGYTMIYSWRPRAWCQVCGMPCGKIGHAWSCSARILWHTRHVGPYGCSRWHAWLLVAEEVCFGEAEEDD